MEKALYYLIDLDKTLTKEDFTKILSMIGELHGIGINTPKDIKNSAYLFYENLPFTPKLTYTETPNKYISWGKPLPNAKIELETDLTDHVTALILKELLLKHGIRLFFTNLNCFLPKRQDLHECITYASETDTKSKKILANYGFKAVFVIENSFTYFAENEADKSIHIINDNLLYHLAKLENDTPSTDEFNYKVAENLEEFVRMYDAELLPTLFYQYYKKSFKIMNYSGFDIENPGRKVFIKPYILEYNQDKVDFFKIAWDQSALLFMDKIRQGENLDRALKRILKEELKIADDYLGATVSRIIEFDLDKENNLTPRLVVRVFVKEAHLTSEQKEKKDRTWISFDQLKK